MKAVRTSERSVYFKTSRRSIPESCHLPNLKIHHCVHNSLPLIPILKHTTAPHPQHLFTDYCCSCRWRETKFLNCGHQLANCSSPGDIWAWRTMVDVDWGKPKIRSPERSLAILPSYQSNSKLGGSGWSKLWIFYFSHTLLDVAKSYNMGPPALLPFQKKVCCGFLSLLKIHRLGRAWTREPWAQ